MRDWKKRWNWGLVALAIGATIYGGSKPIPVADIGADDGIVLAGITADYDATNDVSAIEVAFTGNSVTTATPVSVRNAETEQWRELVKIDATITSDLPTNILAFATAGNATTNRFWWVGTNTPPVVVTSEGITITNFVASSRSVHIAWTCDDPKATEFAIQRRRTNPTARSYVQDGLIAMWDGIDHGKNPLVWRDISGHGYDLTVNARSSFTANALKYIAYTSNGAAYLPGRLVPGVVQVELCCNLTEKTNNSLLFINGAIGSTTTQAVVLTSHSSYGVETSYNKRHNAYVRQLGYYNLSATWDTLYANGAKVIDTTFQTDGWSGGNLTQTYLFGRGDSQYGALGEIYSVRLYSRALTEDEVATNYRIDQARFFGDNDWETVATTEGGSFDYIGFTVGESWEWRIISTYTEGEE